MPHRSLVIITQRLPAGSSIASAFTHKIVVLGRAWLVAARVAGHPQRLGRRDDVRRRAGLEAVRVNRVVTHKKTNNKVQERIDQ